MFTNLKSYFGSSIENALADIITVKLQYLTAAFALHVFVMMALVDFIAGFAVLSEWNFS